MLLIYIAFLLVLYIAFLLVLYIAFLLVLYIAFGSWRIGGDMWRIRIKNLRET